jgi:hypothetical protein
MTPGNDDVFSDAALQLQLSTGASQGHGRGASHWKDDAPTGTYSRIVDPSVVTGATESITGADLRAPELIGWDVVAVPEPSSCVLAGSVAAGLVCYRRRQRTSRLGSRSAKAGRPAYAAAGGGREVGWRRLGALARHVAFPPFQLWVISGNLRRRSIRNPSQPEVALDNPFHFTAAQANALAAVIELESVWENLPSAAATASASEGWKGLNAKQRAFDAYQALVAAYNREFRPPHHGERPATTPVRLGAWCRRIAQIYGQADRSACPVQLLEKVHRCASRLAARLGAAPCPRVTAPVTTGDAVAELGRVADWCDGLGAARIPA